MRPNSPLTKVVGTGGYWTAQKMIPAPAPEAPRLRPKEKVLAQAAAAQPDELVSVTFILKDEPADWKSFRNASSKAERQAWIQARNSSLAPTRQALVSWLAGNGAVDIEPFWMTMDRKGIERRCTDLRSLRGGYRRARGRSTPA